MITVTIVPAQSPMCLPPPVCSAHRSVQRSFAVLVKVAPANGSQSTRAKVTRSQSLPGCGSTQRRTTVTGANGRRDGKRFIGRHADLRRDIPLACSRKLQIANSKPARISITKLRGATVWAAVDFKLERWAVVTLWGIRGLHVDHSFNLFSSNISADSGGAVLHQRAGKISRHFRASDSRAPATRKTGARAN